MVVQFGKNKKLNRKKDPEMDTTTQTKGCVNPDLKKEIQAVVKIVTPQNCKHFSSA